MSTASSDPAPGRRTVLIVEDDPGTRHVLSSGLATTLGMFDVLTAEHGQEALELLERGRVDVVVTDLAMPIMDGFALIGALSNRAAAPPVIVLSALAPTTVSAGLDGYDGLTVLRKPASYAEVARAVLDTLERHALGQVAGIPLPSVLQLVEAERRSCALSVTSGRRRGKLYFESGRLVNAFSEDFGAEGEAAAYDILTWARAAIEFERLPDTVRRMIDRSTQSLLIEVARRQDATRGVTAAARTPAPPAPWRAVPVRSPAGPDDPEPDVRPPSPEAAADVAAPDANAPEVPARDAPAPEAPVPANDATDPGAPNAAPADGAPEPEDAVPGTPALAGDATDGAREAMTPDPDPAMADATADAANAAAPEPVDALWAPEPADSDAATAGDLLETLYDPAPAGPDGPASGSAEPVVNAAPPVGTGPASNASAPHVDLIAAIDRLTHRVRDADAALAAVADEVAAFREAQRRYDDAVRRQEDRRRALDEARRDVAQLARQILERMDGLFDPGADPSPTAPDLEHAAPDAGAGPR